MLALGLARPQDRLILCELHPAGAGALRRAVARNNRAKVIEIDGYIALNAYVPPPERRGLVLIDPPFEARTEFEAMTAALVGAHRKWPTGLYALWYPLKDRRRGRALHLQPDDLGAAPDGAGRTRGRPPALQRDELGGCGMILVNPPFTLEQEAATLLPFLAARLGRSEPGSWRWRVLAGE